MRKMVNSMSAKMEIGSPMASMYLLGNPDHYTSHKYVPFAWRQYFVPSSAVDDYRYRPAAYNNMTLYEWVQCYAKMMKTVKYTDEFLEDEPNDEENDQDIALETEILNSELKDDESDWETDDEDDEILEKEAKKRKENKPVDHPFMPKHALFLSHSVSCNFDKLYTTIPNFIGGSIPRSDKGDRAAYCMAILTLFKPWRSPGDLKDTVSTWDQAFREHTFTDRQSQLIKNFDVRYECNDARDDHFAQMKKKMKEAKAAGKYIWPSGFLSYKDKFADDLNEFDYGSDDDNLEDNDNDVEKGPRTLRMLAEAKDMRNIMQTSGWLNPSVNGLPDVDMDQIMPPLKPRMEWISIVKHQREGLTANKLANLPPMAQSAKKRKVPEGTEILSYDYFNHRSNVEAVKNSDIVSSIIMSYGLNTEQTRAFRIVADHAAGPQTTPLRMYLGGMGGTGKSEVLKAIIEFFKRRNEDYRYLVLGPTGSTAALLNGFDLPFSIQDSPGVEE
ncbi:hypothetical protein C8F04DRAFT_963937 [Mycena alexandri]|uniref:ATP-dependent DNA helicase n=1 Tax=Mycena alexandri TaxID=1745969 RepID=A0AAD6SJ52_9AGAR|nr:hypothetical protein C8F04DRAFT_963937 [Mycena alexandri]